MNPRPLAWFAPALLALAPACIYVDDDDYHDPYIEEAEPNDVHWSAMDLGTLGVGERLLLRGNVTDSGFDRFDGFAFRSAVPMDVEFALYAEDPHDDFDLELFDPYTLHTVAVWQSADNPESGFFSVWNSGFEFHLVVSSFHGAGNYTLEVRGTGLGWGGDGVGAAASPNPGEAGSRGAPAGLSATGRGGREEALRPAVDWALYGVPRQAEAPQEEAGPPWVGVTLLTLDPVTGRVLGLERRRLPRALLAPRED
jgi:hypothetical protein